MEKMRTKDAILAGMDDNIDRRRIEVLIDIRDLLRLLAYPTYEVGLDGKIRKIKVKD